MTDRELMQQALEALEALEPAECWWKEPCGYCSECKAASAVAALRERLREPEMQVIDEMAEVPWDKLRERLAQPKEHTTRVITDANGRKHITNEPRLRG